MSKSIMYDLYHGRISPWERKATQSAERNEVKMKLSALQTYEKRFRKMI